MEASHEGQPAIPLQDASASGDGVQASTPAYQVVPRIDAQQNQTIVASQTHEGIAPDSDDEMGILTTPGQPSQSSTQNTVTITQAVRTVQMPASVASELNLTPQKQAYRAQIEKLKSDLANVEMNLS